MANQTTPAIQVKDSNVGIGTTSPAYKLDVSGSLNVAANVYNYIGGNKAFGGNGSTFLYLYTGTTALSILNNADSSELVRITNDGNVGIGTTSPVEKLDVRGGAYINGGTNDNAYDATLYVTANSSNDWGIFVSKPSHDYGIISQVANGSDFGFSVYDGTTHNFRVKGNGTTLIQGNVGIGTTGPASLVHIDRSSSSNNITGTPSIIISNRNSTSGTFIGGGIFNNAYRDVSDSSITAGVWFENQNSTDAGALAKQSAIVFGAQSYATGYNTPSERMRITSAGNVGIGTTSPGAKFQVTDASSSITLQDYLNGAAIFLDGVNGDFIGGDYFHILADGSSYLGVGGYAGGTTPLNVTNAGNVGIGTNSPSYKLQVQGDSYVGGNFTSTGYGFFNGEGLGASLRVGGIYSNLGLYVPSSYDMQFDLGWDGVFKFTRGNSERMRIVGSTGNVGIGTTSPGYKLDVTGDINFTSTLKFGGVNVIHGTFADIYANIRVIRNASTSVSDGMYIGYDNSGGASGHLRFFANGTNERMRIDASTGNVGIGTTAPSKKFVVRSADNTTNTFAGFYAENESQGVEIWYAGIQAGGSNGNVSLHLASKGTGDVLVTNGNVGIGTTSPSYKLEVVGGSVNTQIARFITADHPAHSIGLGVDAQGTNWGASIFQDDIKRFTVESNGGILVGGNYQGSDAPANGAAIEGNVGIGTSSPGAKLDVAGDIRLGGTATYNSVSVYNNSASGGGGYLAYQNGVVQAFFGAAGWYTGTTDTGVVIGTDSSSRPIRFYTDTERMRITGDGNVGIGTTSPAVKLHVVGTESRFGGVASGYISVYNANSRSGYLQANEGSDFRIASDTNDMTFYVNGSERVRFTVGGNVGIGTTAPSEKLHVDGSTLVTYNNSFQSTNSVGNKAILARVSPTSGIVNYAEYATAANLNGFVIGSDDARVKGNITGDSLEFITNTSTRMTILSSGNVGINTTTPGSTLHVIGDVLIQTGALGVGVNPNATDGRIDASNDIVAFSTSDRRLKENITPITNALEKVRSLTGVEFDWKEETKSVHGYEGHDVGVIAQDVQAVLPEAVRTNDSGYLSVRYEKMIALLVEANKELADRVEQLEKLIK